MNKNYRVIWNGSLRVFQVCSELVKAGKGSSSVNSVDKPMPGAFPSEKSTVFMAISVRFSTLFLSVLLTLPSTASAVIVVDNGQEVTITSTNSPVVDTLDIGSDGTGTLNIINGGNVTTPPLLNILGRNASGSGIIHLDGATSSLNLTAFNSVLYVGREGSGLISVENGATLNHQSSDSVVLGSESGGVGTISLNNNGNFYAQNLFIGSSGTGIINLANNSILTMGNRPGSAFLSIGGAASGVGELNVDSGSVVNLPDISYPGWDYNKIGGAGNGSVTLSNGGTLATGNSVQKINIALESGSSGRLNIGAADGSAAVAPGNITGNGTLFFGQGDGRVVFNHTDNSAAGYQFSTLMAGNGRVDHNAGHTVLTAANTYTGETTIHGGTLTLDSMGGEIGSGGVVIDAPGTFELNQIPVDSSGYYNFTYALSGSGLLSANLASPDNIFSFSPSAGTTFSGVVELKNNHFSLSGDNTAAMGNAILQISTGNTTTVGDGEQTIKGLAFNGGKAIFNTVIPANTTATSLIQVDTLVAGAGSYGNAGRSYNVDGTGTVQVNIDDIWNDPGAANTDTTLNLLQQDDTSAHIQLVKANTVVGSAGALTLTDQNEAVVPANKTLQIAQNGTVVANGEYGFRLTTAPGDGLYVNYGLKQLEILDGQTLVFSENSGATGAASDMSAKIIGTVTWQ